jgi:hypothetical protein
MTDNVSVGVDGEFTAVTCRKHLPIPDFFFAEEGNMPAHFAQVLRAAGQRLVRSIAA